MARDMLLVTGSPPALEAALADAVAAAKQPDPLAPVAVLIGGTLLRPYLGRRLASLTGGIVNVHFLTPGELGLALGERALTTANRRPLPPLADRILLRQIGAAHEGYFEPVRETPGFSDALFHLFGELRGAGYDAAGLRSALAGACETEAKEEALGTLYSEWLTQRSDFYGAADALLAAEAEAAPWTSLIVHGLWEASPALRGVLERLSERTPLTVLLPDTGTDADEAVGDLREWAGAFAASERREPGEPSADTGLAHVQGTLFAPDAAGTRDGTVKLISAPDPAREVRELARTCLRWAREGVHFHEMALVYRHPEIYRPIVESVFDEAGIPLYLHEGTPLIERPLGRRIVALLNLLDSDLERRAVMEFITDASLPQSTRERYGKPSASRWDRFSRDAGVVRGLEQWRDRLAVLADGLRRLDREWATKQARDVDMLRTFVLDLDEALSDHRERAAWSEHLRAFRRLVGRYVTQPDRVFETLEGLGRLDAVSGGVPFRAFIEVVRGALENLRADDDEHGRQGAFGRRGVNVLDANSVRHLRFRTVAVMGLSERAFPPPPRPDPLLLDDERERLNAQGAAPVPLRVRRPDPEPLQFLAAVSAASEQLVASYPRKGTGEGRAQLPSVFFRAIAEAATGERVSAEEVDSLPEDLLTHVRGSRIGAAALNHALSLPERDRTFVEQHGALGRAALIRQEPRLQRAFAARAARQGRTLTPHDGVLSPVAARRLAALPRADRPLSPSGLETYATCPHQYFLATRLGLKAIEEPEETIQISPLDRGSLVHRVLERFLSEPPRDGEPVLHGASEEARLLEIFEEECKRVEDHGETGYPLIWRHDRAELREDMARWLETERQDPSFDQLPHGRYEVSFGRPGGGDGEGSSDPIEITTGEARLRVSGRIDRLNWDTARTRYRIIDYKTGKNWKGEKSGRLDGGRALQLPVYLLAGAQVLDLEPEQGSAEYHFATRRGRYERVTFDGDDLRERGEELDELLEGIAEGIEDGVYLRAPEGERTCQFCDFDPVCPSNRFRQIERKRDDEHQQAFHAMRGIE